MGTWSRQLIAAALRPRSLGLALSVALAVFGLYELVRTVVRLYPDLVIDDAYITYRYADNWARGLGPTWNAMDPPAEGYSTPLYMALLALAKALFDVDLVSFSKVVCLLCGAGTLGATFVLILRATRSLAWALAGAGLLAANPILAVWSVGEMETALYTLLFTLSALCVLEARRRGSRRAWIALAVALSLLALTRTEGPVAALAFAIAALPRDQLRWPLNATLKVLAVVACVAGAHLLVRRAYYGLWLPLPAYEKGMLFGSQERVTDFMKTYGLWIALWLPALRARRIEVRAALRYALIVTLLLAFVVLHVDPVMSAHQRYLFPIVPLLLFGAVVGLQQVTRSVRDPALALALVALVAIATGRDIAGGSRDEVVRAVEGYSAPVIRSHVGLGRWLAARVHDPEVQLVVADCGVIPFYSRLRVIDVFGLNDPYIAAHGVDTDYIFGRRPELIVLSPLARDAPIRGDPRLRSRYTFVRSFAGFYALALYRRNDFPLQR